MARKKADKTTQEANAEPRFRVESISIQNYRAFESINVFFPEPRLRSEHDACVIGSRNGVGKTSVLEAVALTFAMMAIGRSVDVSRTPWGSRFNLAELLCRNPSRAAEIAMHVRVNEIRTVLRLAITQQQIGFSADPEFAAAWGDRRKRASRGDELEEFWLSVLPRILGYSAEPYLGQSLLYFNSYRKVREGSPELGLMVGGSSHRYRYGPPQTLAENSPLSVFKTTIIRSVMGKSGLFERVEAKDSDASFEQLNGLLERFANCRFDTLRPDADNTLELRVARLDGRGTFGFDNLSAGQKEMIATLFLIWRHAKDGASVVLIDEPETHLNAEWQRILVLYLREMAPNIQYVLATHSEDIFSSVTAGHRLLLELEPS